MHDARQSRPLDFGHAYAHHNSCARRQDFHLPSLTHIDHQRGSAGHGDLGWSARRLAATLARLHISRRQDFWQKIRCFNKPSYFRYFYAALKPGRHDA